LTRILQLFDVLKAAPLARLVYHQYTHITQIFNMEMPFMPDDITGRSVLAGSTTQIDTDQVVNGDEPAERKYLPKSKILDHLP
jgi:hypothetical protein